MDATVHDPHPEDRRARRNRLQKCFIGWHCIRTGIGMALPRDSIYLSVDALPEPLERVRVRKVPTGIADLDSIVDGGFPSGSTILLWGDIGAGMQEYVYTAGSKTALVNERPEARHYYLGDRCDDSDLPTQVCYVTFSRSKDIILQELATSFNGDYYRAFRDHTVFKDFSSVYFRHSVVPATWTNEDDVFDRPSTNILEELVAFLDENAHDSMVVIDSLTDLAISDIVEIKDLVTTINGLQRVAKRWNGLVYLMLTRGILERRHESLLMDSTDGCLVFEWRTSTRSSTRQRYMYLEKFTGVLPHLPREKIVETEAESAVRDAGDVGRSGNFVLTGIDGLDEMLGRGVPTGHIITVLGSFGTGKTTFALQFLMQGLINGEKAIFISLEEDADSVIANAASFGWDLPTYIKEKKLHIVKLEPADAKTTVTRIRSELPDFIKRSGASRVAIDSISLLNMLFADDKERREKLFSLCKQLKSTDATCIFTAEVKDDNPRSSRDGLVEYVSDGVIGLRFNERENGEVQLVMQVIKMRRLKHPRSVKPYSITEQGLEVHGDMEVF